MSDVAFSDGDNFIRNLVTVPIGCGYRRPDVVVMKTGSLGLPMSLEDLMIDLRVDDPDSDGATVERMAEGAAALLELRSGYAVRAGTYEALLPSWWHGPLELFRGPLRAVEAVEYATGASTWATVDPADYYARGRARSFRVFTLDTFDRPEVWGHHADADRVRIRFAAGFDPYNETGESEGAHPIDDGLRTTWVALTAHFFKNRELYAAGALETLEAGAAGLLSAYRTYW